MAKTKKAEAIAQRKLFRKKLFDVVHEVVTERGDEPYAEEGDAWIYYPDPETSYFLPVLLADALTDRIIEFIEKEMRYE